MIEILLVFAVLAAVFVLAGGEMENKLANRH